MRRLIEQAPAKVNLDLRVIGRRPDGYHELRSLVAFATIGDRLELEPGSAFSLAVDGPFAAAIDSDAGNLVAKAVSGALARTAGLLAGHVRLTKLLPVAAGLGGGSADAAAALRLLARANPGQAEEILQPSFAAALGADVPVCLASRASSMTGIGEQVSLLPCMPELAILLVNPGVALSTGAVFKALCAPPAPPWPAGGQAAPQFRDPADLLEALRQSGNDLEPAARRLCPPIGQILERLRSLPGALLHRMSGSGPTCFALFATLDEAQSARAALAANAPAGWWIRAAALR